MARKLDHELSAWGKRKRQKNDYPKSFEVPNNQFRNARLNEHYDNEEPQSCSENEAILSAPSLSKNVKLSEDLANWAENV